MDIEDHRRSAEFMRRQKLDFQLIVDSIPVPVAVTTPSGEVEGLNKSTLGYFGKSFEELKGWKTSDAVHPDDLEQTIAAQMKAHQQAFPTTLRAATAATTEPTAGTMYAAFLCETHAAALFVGVIC